MAEQSEQRATGTFCADQDPPSRASVGPKWGGIQTQTGRCVHTPAVTAAWQTDPAVQGGYSPNKSSKQSGRIRGRRAAELGPALATRRRSVSGRSAQRTLCPSGELAQRHAELSCSSFLTQAQSEGRVLHRFSSSHRQEVTACQRQRGPSLH